MDQIHPHTVGLDSASSTSSSTVATAITTAPANVTNTLRTASSQQEPAASPANEQTGKKTTKSLVIPSIAAKGDKCEPTTKVHKYNVDSDPSQYTRPAERMLSEILETRYPVHHASEEEQPSSDDTSTTRGCCAGLAERFGLECRSTPASNNEGT